MNKSTVSGKLTALLLVLCLILGMFPLNAGAENFSAEVTVSKMCVRSGPSAKYSILGYLSKGTVVTVVAYEDGIAKITYNGKTGYCQVSDLKRVTEQEDEETETCTITSSSAKVYASASTSAKVLCTVKKGQSFTLLATSGSWAKLKNGSTIGYVLLSDTNLASETDDTEEKTAEPTVTPTATPLGLAYIKKNDTKIYKSYSTKSTVMTTVDKGESFTILDMNDDWVKLENGSTVGYALRSAVSVVPGVTATPKPTATPAPTAVVIDKSISIAAIVSCSSKVYKSGSLSSANLGTVSAGTILTVLGTSDGWALVKSGSKTGYMSVDSLIKLSDVTMSKTTSISAVTTQSNVKCYEYATEVSECLGTLNKGVSVTVLANDGTWAYIKRGSYYGYCAVSALSKVSDYTLDQDENVKGIITSKTTAYKYASVSSTNLGTVSAGTQVTILARNDTWALIKSGSNKGYIDVDCVAAISDITLTANENYTATVTANASVYSYMSSKSSCIGTAKKGWTVTVLAHDSTWALVKRGTYKGYMLLSKLDLQLNEFVSPTVKTLDCTVVKVATVYDDAKTDAGKLGTLDVGDSVTANAYTSKWIRFEYNGTTAYLLKSNVSSTSYEELKSGSTSSSAILTLQKALEDKGYFDGLPAGNYGSLTVNAVKRFQTEVGLNVTGVADEATLRVLYSGYAPDSPIRSVSLSKGSKGTDVTRLQTRLTYKGYMSSSIDGDYGAITQKAVALYQKTAGLSETGTANAATMASLFSSSAPKCTSSSVGNGVTINESGTASTGNYSTDADEDTASGTASDEIEQLIAIALQQLGKPYIYATSGPNSFDCSGFTGYCYRQLGITLGRSAYAVGYGKGMKIETIEELQRGDIVCLNTLTDNDLSDHVGIYLGNGKFIHASSAAEKVIISSLTSGYYNRVFSWGRRIL